MREETFAQRTSQWSRLTYNSITRDFIEQQERLAQNQDTKIQNRRNHPKGRDVAEKENRFKYLWSFL